MDKAAICVRIEIGPQTHYRSAGGPTNVLKNNKQSNHFFDLLRTSVMVCTTATSTNTAATLRCKANSTSWPCVPKSESMIRAIDKIKGKAKTMISQKAIF